jgi:hypothetical protein
MLLRNCKYYLFFLLTGLSYLMSSCFKEDEKIYPPLPGDATVYSFDKSIYDFQSYFDFSSDSSTVVSPNDSWQIEFATAPNAWDIRVNSSAYYKVYPTSDTSFFGIPSVSDPLKYLFDASSGNPDSCSFSTWLDRSVNPFMPTKEVFLVGQYDGIKMKPKWKIRIESVNDTAYDFTFAVFPSGLPVSVKLIKDKSIRYQQFSLSDKTAINIEPSSDDYDLLFTQYGTILYDNQGVPTPYFVRGILLNPKLVTAALDTLHSFSELTYDIVKDFTYSKVRDVIGHTWKDVKVDQVGGTAEYFVNPKLNWIIRDTEGFIYKMHFLEFYNSQVEVGYTTIEYQRL